jgi:hypothetical protein
MKGSTSRLGQSSKKAKSNPGNRSKRNQNKIIRPWLNNLTMIIKSYSIGNFSNANGYFNNAYGNFHPNYALNNGSITASLGRGQVLGNNSSTDGYNVKFVVKRADIELTFFNKEAFNMIISLFPVPSNMGSIFTAKPQTDYAVHSIKKNLSIHKLGVVGDILKVKFSVDLAKLEGYTFNIMKCISGYQCTTAAVGSIISYFYIQTNSLNATQLTSAGMDYELRASFLVEGVFQNLALLT